ncbi:aldo/keto reductase [Nonomuraea sp. NPDC049758]|uniref:aldo/keto reductase n=1 Tax=Nonomuraea sp. NPDC049758 TaxID=3154360 RepID=UPI00344A2B50
MHAGNTPAELPAYCESQQILVEAYSPIAHGAILKNADVRAMAEKYGVSVPQLCIRYTLQLGTVSLPKTANPEHMRSNADVDFEISDADMDALRGPARCGPRRPQRLPCLQRQVKVTAEFGAIDTVPSASGSMRHGRPVPARLAPPVEAHKVTYGTAVQPSAVTCSIMGACTAASTAAAKGRE